MLHTIRIGVLFLGAMLYGFLAIAQTVLLQEGTLVRCGFVNTLSEEELHEGDDISLVVKEDVIAGGHTVIQKGSSVKGRITKCTFISEFIISENNSVRSSALQNIPDGSPDRILFKSSIVVNLTHVRTITGTYISLKNDCRKTFSSSKQNISLLIEAWEHFHFVHMKL